MNAGPDAPGIHGKLPSHGDFITRRLPREFVDSWDDWLQHGIAASKTALGDEWLNIYLTSPIWSFVLESGICGTHGWAGILMPSVDRVGRYFPLTLAVQLPAPLSPCDVAGGDGGWFERARSLALSSLEQDDFSLDSFDVSVAELGSPADDGTPVQGAVLPTGAFGLFLPLSDRPRTALLGLTQGLLEQQLGRYSMWWSEGSELVPACVLVTPKLPDPAAWSAFLDGRFDASHWLAAQPLPNDAAGASA